jgi:hypothetical protein
VSRYRKDLFGVQPFRLDKLQIDPRGWVADLLRDRERASVLVADHRTTVDQAFAAFQAAAKHPSWVSVAKVPLAQLSRRTVDLAQQALEEAISNTRWGPKKKFECSNVARKWLLDHELFPDDVDAESIKRAFSTRFSRPTSPPRPLISNHPDAGVPEPRAPLGALPHKTSKELRVKVLETLNSDLDRIKAAAHQELKIFTSERDHLSTLLTSEYDNSILPDLYRRSFERTASTGKNIPDWIRSTPAKELLSAYASLVKTAKSSKKGKIAPAILDAGRLCEFARSQGIRAVERFSYRLIHPQILSQREFLACALLIQAKSGWNFSTIAGLCTDNITHSEGDYIITGVKQKTGQTLPPVLIQSRDHAEQLALRLLFDNLQECKSLRWTTSSASQLIFNTGLLRAGSLTFYANWQDVLAKFIDRYELPEFTLDQVRTQVLAITQVESGNLDETKRKAGHAFVSTTSHYLDQIILYSLNSAINLEYQHALENSVRYVLDGNLNHPENLYAPSSEDRDANDEPWNNLLEVVQGFLKGMLAPESMSSTNSILRINVEALRDLVLMRRFYLEHWRTLLAENREKFEKLQLPNLLLNLGLYAIVARGPYRHVLASLEAKIPK